MRACEAAERKQTKLNPPFSSNLTPRATWQQQHWDRVSVRSLGVEAADAPAPAP